MEVGLGNRTDVYSVFESKQVSGKERENCGGSRDEGTSSGREAVMGNVSKAYGT